MRRLHMPSHGTLVAYTALFASLGGTAVALENASITEREIATGAVRSSEIATGAVKRSEIKTGAVGSAEVRTDAIRAREIREGAVSADELTDGSVGSGELLDGAVTGSKLGSDAVESAAVKDGSLALADLAQVVTTVTYDPPLMSPGDCVNEDSVAVPNKQAGDVALVLPGPSSGSDGWNGDFTLRGYGSGASTAGNTIAVVVCRPFGTAPIDAGPQPLRVLLFR